MLVRGNGIFSETLMRILLALGCRNLRKLPKKRTRWRSSQVLSGGRQPRRQVTGDRVWRAAGVQFTCYHVLWCSCIRKPSCTPLEEHHLAGKGWSHVILLVAWFWLLTIIYWRLMSPSRWVRRNVDSFSPKKIFKKEHGSCWNNTLQNVDARGWLLQVHTHFRGQTRPRGWYQCPLPTLRGKKNKINLPGNVFLRHNTGRTMSNLSSVFCDARLRNFTNYLFFSDNPPVYV